jgi:Sulfotransferase domain
VILKSMKIELQLDISSSKSLGNSVTHVERMSSPRYIKTHLPEQLLPTSLDHVKPKIIYTARNPKDLCVSYYHYFLLVHDAKGASFEDFCDLILDDKAPYGSIWQHMLAFWRRRNDPNVLFLKYEDMKRDLPTVIEKCVEFLELKPLTDAELTRICEHLKFKRMQTNSAVNLEAIMYNQNSDGGADAEMVGGQSENKFIRKGEVGDWKNHMSDEMSTRFDEWIEKRFKHSGLEFQYE